LVCFWLQTIILMSRRTRLFLLSVSLILLACAILALVYVFWPLPVMQVQATLPPELLAPP
jgi:hypothetical protein